MTVIVDTSKSNSSTDTNPTALNRIDGCYGCICIFRNRNARLCLVISHGLVVRFSGLIPVSIKVLFDLFLHCHFYVLQDERGETRHAAAARERQTGWADRVVRRVRWPQSSAQPKHHHGNMCKRGIGLIQLLHQEESDGEGVMERERERQKEGGGKQTYRQIIEKDEIVCL